MILIDTNIFLEVLLGGSRSRECEELLGKVAAGELEGVVTHFSIHSIEAIVGRKVNVITQFLQTIDQTQGLSVYDTSLADEVAAAMLMKASRRDFDDTLQLFVAKKLGAKAIVSYDRHFDGMEIPRLEPKGVATS